MKDRSVMKRMGTERSRERNRIRLEGGDETSVNKELRSSDYFIIRGWCCIVL